MRVQLPDGKALLEVRNGKSLTQVLTETRDAIRTVAIVPVKVIRDKTVHSSRDAAAHPGLQHLSPMRIVQARPILAHAANAVVLVRNRFAGSVLLQQFHRVRDGLWAEELFVPLIAIEPEKAARPLRTFRIADEKFHVQMTDHLRAAAMQLGVEPREPLRALPMASDGKMPRITIPKWRVGQAPEV